ncbi:hypothetical protein [Absidia glauca]|uniref:SAC3/GANP/THP3 conserved domain-containing protein n=1 Tax=Absidia glauca TaxID=4829 RepID=A0A163M5J8_ABSGL|nr:hypothetical protein [Absidia glauca]
MQNQRNLHSSHYRDRSNSYNNRNDNDEKINDSYTPPLRKSIRDWNKAPSTNVLDLPLISRSSDNANQPSLKEVELQIELWNEICQKTMDIKNPADGKQWIPLTQLLRKLREGIWASRWSGGNIRFAIKVYEESVHTGLRAQEFPEFRKAVRALVDDLYKLDDKGVNGHFLALDVIYEACHLQRYQEAIHSLLQHSNDSRCYNRNEINFAKQVVRALSAGNWIRFFRLCRQVPHPAYLVIMDLAVEPLRQHALTVMQKVYYTASLSWLASSLDYSSLSHDSLAITLRKLDTPTALIDRIENDVVYFKKKRK